MINSEDFETESQKDSVYLLEKTIQEEIEFWKWYNELHRKPAKVEVINEKSKKDESEQSNILPI